MVKRFAPLISRTGPAMSDSVVATIQARTGRPDDAYSTWRKSWQEFTGPFLLFGEKRAGGRTYFTTGAAGSLQAVVFGFLGFRIDARPAPGAVWSKKLHGGRWLSVKPRLPKAWRSVTFRNFSVFGKKYTLTATHTYARVIQGD